MIELMVTITISVILAIITVPSMVNWYEKDQFIAQSRAMIDMLYDARAAAIADKKCSNGQLSLGWSWFWDGNDPYSVSLRCKFDSTKINERTININSEIMEIATSGFFFDDTNQISPNNETSISFDMGSGNSSIEISDSGRQKYDIKRIQLPFIFTKDRSIIRTICFDRIANLPIMSSDSNCND